LKILKEKTNTNMETKVLSEKLKKYYVPVWAPPDDFVITGGKGPYLFDAEGNSYIDFVTGIAVNALGHQHPALVKAFKGFAHLPYHASSLFMQKDRVLLAEQLVEQSFADKVFFCNSGTEAIEGAIKFARKWAATNFSGTKNRILSFRNGFHGRSYGALSATAQEKFHAGFGPLVPGFTYLTLNDLPGFTAAADQESVCAVIVEPVQAEGGIIPCDPEWIKEVRALCTKRNILLVFDEIQTGMGRLGTLWGYEQFRVTPDIMTLAKALGGGIPFGAVLCTNAVARCLTAGDHGNTTGGSPVAAHLGLAVLEQLAAEGFWVQVSASSTVLRQELERIAKKMPDQVGGVRGMGMLQGLVLKTDVAAVVNRCRRLGLLVCKAGPDVLRLLPPLTVKPGVIKKAAAIIRQALHPVA
jgi:predicted acetylornithine/succinylornithine family transaminase